MSFNEWRRGTQIGELNPDLHHWDDYEDHTQSARSAWDFQQNKIQSLESQLKTAKEVIRRQREAIEFYGDLKSWNTNSWGTKSIIILDKDWTKNEGERGAGTHYGGKLARQTLRETEEMMKEIL